jgi:hypothetical protein
MSISSLEQEREGVAYAIAPRMTTIGADAPDADVATPSMNGDKERVGGAWAFLARTIIVWSICELALEVMSSATTAECVAAMLGRVVWIPLAIGALYGHRLSKRLLIFLCGASALAVSVQLPSMFKTSEVFFGMSLIDCLVKGMALVTALL